MKNRKERPDRLLSEKLYDFASEVATGSKGFFLSTINGEETGENEKVMNSAEKSRQWSSVNDNDNNSSTPDSSDFDVDVPDLEEQDRPISVSKFNVDEAATATSTPRSSSVHLTEEQYPYIAAEKIIDVRGSVIKGYRSIDNK